jgi:hypothetical protein
MGLVNLYNLLILNKNILSYITSIKLSYFLKENAITDFRSIPKSGARPFWPVVKNKVIDVIYREKIFQVNGWDL